MPCSSRGSPSGRIPRTRSTSTPRIPIRCGPPSPRTPRWTYRTARSPEEARPSAPADAAPLHAVDGRGIRRARHRFPGVFLRSIRLRGFKSFPDPVEVRLERGVAVVVGPNGSGKSNISDAIV
ncbi:MAG: AAA family ATPase, partial [Actinobacteria bacterium]|nr:AAA family ATPase [Actinomycetota bacterium]